MTFTRQQLSFTNTMAEDEDGISDKKSQNSNNASTSQDSKQNSTKPDLGIEEAKYDIQENGDMLSVEPSSSTSSAYFRGVVFCSLNIKTFFIAFVLFLQSLRER